MMDELYKEYGKAMIDFEIARARLDDVKKRIVEELNKRGRKDDKDTNQV